MATLDARTPPLFASPREGPTLEDVLSGAWEDLSAHRAAACPICDGVDGAPLRIRAVGGRGPLRGCGTELG